MSVFSLVLLIAAGLCLVEFLISVTRSRQMRSESQTRKRLRAIAVRLHESGPDGEEDSILREGLGDGSFQLDGILEGIPLFRRAELLLYRAGFTAPVWRFATLSLAVGAIAGWNTVLRTGSYGYGAVAGLGVALLPWLLVAWRKRKRMELFERQFPEALELICRALRAGHALSAGLRMVGEELDDPIAGEFTQVADEVALGLETRRALVNLCDRSDVPDLTFFATAVLLQRETGGNLAEVMQKLGYVVRERHKFYGKVRAMTAQNRGAAVILLFTPPVFLVLMYGVDPGFVEPLWSTSSGQTLGLVALAMVTVGYALARRLAVVKA
jgi:tight adherence protein B